jgi:hypothetical protein
VPAEGTVVESVASIVLEHRAADETSVAAALSLECPLASEPNRHFTSCPFVWCC